MSTPFALKAYKRNLHITYEYILIGKFVKSYSYRGDSLGLFPKW